MCIYIYVYVICTWGLTELAIGAQRTAGEGRTVLGRPNPKSEKIRDYNLNEHWGYVSVYAIMLCVYRIYLLLRRTTNNEQ